MAGHDETAYTTADGNDYPAHEQSYLSFLLMVAIGTVYCLNIAVALAIGGYKGAWWTMTGVLLVATVIAAHGLATGAKVPSYVMLALALVILALS
jgi:hypothetical protein